MTDKRRQDDWNEENVKHGEISEVMTNDYVQNILQNSEGVSADYEKFKVDKTFTPKVLHPNKRD